MSVGILNCQHKDGFWYPSLVSTNYAGKEMTGTALFLYGMSWGINKGYLNKMFIFQLAKNMEGT